MIGSRLPLHSLGAYGSRSLGALTWWLTGKNLPLRARAHHGEWDSTSLSSKQYTSLRRGIQMKLSGTKTAPGPNCSQESTGSYIAILYYFEMQPSFGDDGPGARASLLVVLGSV